MGSILRKDYFFELSVLDVNCKIRTSCYISPTDGEINFSRSQQERLDIYSSKLESLIQSLIANGFSKDIKIKVIK